MVASLFKLPCFNKFLGIHSLGPGGISIEIFLHTSNYRQTISGDPGDGPS